MLDADLDVGVENSRIPNGFLPFNFHSEISGAIHRAGVLRDQVDSLVSSFWPSATAGRNNYHWGPSQLDSQHVRRKLPRTSVVSSPVRLSGANRSACRRQERRRLSGKSTNPPSYLWKIRIRPLE